MSFLKFIYSDKARKFCEISTVNLSYVKFTVEILQNILAFSEYMNFTILIPYIHKPSVFCDVSPC